MNKVFLVGNLTADPIAKTTTTGKTLVNFTVACNDNLQGKEKANFFSCVAWNNQANYLASYVKKGDTVAIDGKLNRRSYIDKTGKTVYVTEIIVDSISTIVKRSKAAADSETLVNVNDNFATKIVETDVDFTKPEAKNVDDGLNELDWINEEEGK